MRRIHCVFVVVLQLIAALWAVNACGECLVVTTHGSMWQFRDTVWRYPAFQAHEDLFDVLTTVPLDTSLESFPEQEIAVAESIELTFELDEPIADALLLHLSGETPDYDGFRSSFEVTDPGGVTYELSNHTSERTLHIDQPVQGTYTIRLYSDMGGSFTLEVGAGVSPFLTLDLAAYKAVFVPDIDQLTAREIEVVRAYLEVGGKLVVISDFIQGVSYYSSSNFSALNDLISPSGIRFTEELLRTTEVVTANRQEINVLTDIVESPLTRGVSQVVSTGSTLDLSGSAQGLVFDDDGEAAIAFDRQGLGEYLVVATGIGFNSDFSLHENDLLATRIVEWANGLTSALYFPAAASASGLEGTFWSTDAWIHNQSTVGLDVVGAFLAQRRDNGSAVNSPLPLGMIPAGGFLEVEDIVAALGGAGKVGGVYLAATPQEATGSADLISASSHTWTANPSGAGTFGQGIAAVIAGTKDELRAPGLFQNTGYRTNVGVLNTANATIIMNVSILDSSGVQSAVASWTVLPYEQHQASLSSLGVPALEGGTCVFTVTSGPASFLGFASVVDNDSGDAVYIEAR
ncbi:MAG: hypothetical protein K8R59_02975 [Thermoanaerobaculales bacterium]|nr:hypothetical protein [Thermoanaerobaculales bacterium]